MPRKLYSYKLKRCVPLLTEAEFKSMVPQIKNYRNAIRHWKFDPQRRRQAVQGLDSEEEIVLLESYQAFRSAEERVLDAYEKIAGERLDHPEQVLEARLAYFGRLCPKCARPFRTPRARFCAECGYALPDGEVAGPISET